MHGSMTIKLANGVEIPRVGLGTFKARGEEVSNAVAWALSYGIRHVDTAAIYKNEAEVLSAVRSSPVERRDVFLTTKLSPYQMGHEAATQACESLRDMQPDLVLIHWPGVSRTPPNSPTNALKRLETWRVLEAFYRQGAFRAIGVSNYTAAHLQELVAVASVPPMVNQIEVHPRYPQTELRELCARLGVAVVAYASLGCGTLLEDKVVRGIAKQHDKTPAQVLLRWGLQQGCAVIPKSVRQERIAEFSPDKSLSWQLSGNDMDALAGLEDDTKFCWDPTDIV